LNDSLSPGVTAFATRSQSSVPIDATATSPDRSTASQYASSSTQYCLGCSAQNAFFGPHGEANTRNTLIPAAAAVRSAAAVGAGSGTPIAELIVQNESKMLQPAPRQGAAPGGQSAETAKISPEPPRWHTDARAPPTTTCGPAASNSSSRIRSLLRRRSEARSLLSLLQCNDKRTDGP